jgi:AcrR family transcriptional regulator
MPRVRAGEALRPRKRPLQARSRATVDAILRAAAQVFTAQGYAATTTNHIAERAGVSIGSLYEYFPSKDALLVALMEAHLAEAETILATAAAEAFEDADDVAAVVRRFVRAMVDLHARDRPLHRVLFEEAPLPARMRRQILAIERRVVEHVAEYLRARPGATTRDPEMAAAVVVQAIEGLTHKLVVYGERDTDVDAYVDEMVALVTAYLAAPVRSER